MKETVLFYYNPMSRGRIAHWMLEEVGANYEIKLIDWKTNQQKSEEFLKINPMGKLPGIVHRGITVTETIAICTYLADAFPEAGLAPAVNDPQRGAYYRWLFFTVNCVEQAVADKNIPRINEVPSSQLGYGTYEDTIRVLKDAVREKYLLGDKFTTADLYLSSVLGWYINMKLLEADEILLNYVKRCNDRPSYHRFNDKVNQMMA